jgi:phenylalanyl-tRNA synthetase alpha subunit
MAYPILRPSTLQPADAPIPTAAAKQIFKQYMLQIGYLDRQEVGEHVRYLADELKEHEQVLKDELANIRSNVSDELTELRPHLRQMKKEWAACKEPTEKQSLEDEIEETERQINRSHRELDEAMQKLGVFKVDKREFLVDYINSQVHGQRWREMP